MIIQRDRYLTKLVNHKNNGMVKIITGLRRSGKSFLLFNLFLNHLLSTGTDRKHIISIALDDRINKEYRDPDTLYAFIRNSISDNQMHYLLLDEVQLVKEFEDVLNSCLHIPNLDVFATGSNAKFLSKDIITEFRGRGDQIYVHPLSFQEFHSAFGSTPEKAYQSYSAYGGLPKLFEFSTDEDKETYLKSIFAETYMKDIRERNDLRNDAEMEELLDVLASDIGSLTNPLKIARTFKSLKNKEMHPGTIKKYLDYLSDSFLVEQAKRYDVKGKRYINTPSKYYFTDVGLRNARLNFRQTEGPHLMENILYNELRILGFNVDVGVVEVYAPNTAGKSIKKQTEVDFVCNQADKRYYIQSAFSLFDEEKLHQEEYPLKHIEDSFKKIIITKEPCRTHYTENGILIINLLDFLLDPELMRT